MICDNLVERQGGDYNAIQRDFDRLIIDQSKLIGKITLFVINLNEEVLLDSNQDLF